MSFRSGEIGLHNGLGRGVIINPGQTVPDAFSSVKVVAITPASLSDPQPVADELHEMWVNREPVVIEFSVNPSDLKQSLNDIDDRDLWQVGDRFVFHLHRLHFLAWNNNWDLRNDEPIWWWARKAISLGARPSTVADIELADGTPAYCDGGPIGSVDLPDGIGQIHYTSVENGSLRTMTTGTSTFDLAPDQMRAVHHRGGATRVIAPAGSGKTRVLTERARHVLNNWSIEPAAVCAVAYNTRAADEMQSRLNGVPANIRTLNSLAFAIVNGTNGFGKSQLETNSRRVINERDVRSILNGMVELPRRMNTDPMATWLDALSTTRLGLRDPNEVEGESDDLIGFAEVFRLYRNYIGDQGLLDFDEQIYRSIEILLQDPIARHQAQRRCRLLLVDEFQDLTPAHVLLVRLLASPALDIFAVGDDDQVIYGYAGARPEYLVSFKSLFPGAQEHALEVNYRCPPVAVNSASNLLTRNAPRVIKSITSPPTREMDESALIVIDPESADMAKYTVALIEKWLAEGIAINEIAVLARVNVALLPVQVCLEEHDIPHTTPVDASLLQRTGISTALAYLRIGATPSAIRRADVQSTVHRPGRKIARNVVDMMTKRVSTSINDIRRLGTALSGNDSARVSGYASDLQMVADSMRNGRTAHVLETIGSSVGLGEVMNVLDSSKKEVDRSTHSDDLSALAGVAHLHTSPDSFEPWLRDNLNRPGDDNGVCLSTVHRVKGREWKRVIVYDASNRLFPHTLASDIDEERRIFHVAITRCSEQVVVITPKGEPSPFIEEMKAPGEPPVKRTAKKDKPVTIVDVKSTLDPDSEKRLTALKEWRRGAASNLGKPAFTVLHDAHLVLIAQTNPSSLSELANCRGIGPTKLERWGDEILAALESPSEDTPTGVVRPSELCSPEGQFFGPAEPASDFGAVREANVISDLSDVRRPSKSVS